MDYQLENLGPERFQQFCAALIAKEFPRTQCFPVAQRDGGRDSIVFLPGRSAKEFIVFQVKYVRKPLALEDPHEWLKEIVSDEAPKLMDLIPKGAKEYYLLTNVPGTAHPDSGSIDFVQTEFNRHVNIPAHCWWREDINRRTDDAWNIKWVYPEILTGNDVLRYIVEKGLQEDSQRRTSAIRAYIRDQHDRDKEVRFKQVELHNKLLDLFIDVPLRLRESHRDKKGRRLQDHLRFLFGLVVDDTSYSHEPTVGAATFFLNSQIQENINRTVLEGAPGQGKSTISQYLCQMHRRRILNITEDEDAIQPQHKCAPLRIPFKIDCRDFSSWLNRRNPFATDDPTKLPSEWQKSLESFLAAQVQFHSGGAAFSISDLHAVLRLSSSLIVFDGLDEVADIERRQETVDHILKGTNRLSEISVSLQTIVTSRPAAFANSPGLPEDEFTYLSLCSITTPLIEAYAERWLKARRIVGAEARDVRSVLKDKLDQPHLRELARNPMQLAILLSLIQTRGGALPEKRTNLYDSYVDLFFNRESEKSQVVRDHRDLLVDIHRYLAWVLHSEAQTERSNGSVTAERLKLLVSQFLFEEGHDSQLGNTLFSGMVERVVALVSRVEGTYEFEVQPLREYFAARHLYNTAPYSPAGEERHGTLPDRFDAIARDFYWLNVTRFYAGCYSKGELPSLVDRIEDLSRSEGYELTSHPQQLAGALLSDWVFAQDPKSMRKVIQLLLSDKGLRHITSGARRYRRVDSFSLPEKCGRLELVERCFEQLAAFPKHDYAFMTINLIQANALPNEIGLRWREVWNRVPRERQLYWIEYGLYLSALHSLDKDFLNELVAECNEEERSRRLVCLLYGGHTKFVEDSAVDFNSVVNHFLEGNSDLHFRRESSSLALAFRNSLSPGRYAAAFIEPSPISLVDTWRRVHMPFEFPVDEVAIDLAEVDPVDTDIKTRCYEFVRCTNSLAQGPSSHWATSLENWDTFVEKGRGYFGDRWVFMVLGSIAAGIRSKTEYCDGFDDLFDSSRSLCRRIRYARLRAGASNWWELQLNKAGTEEAICQVLLPMFAWAGPSVLRKNVELADQMLRRLSVSKWTQLFKGIQSVVIGRHREPQEDGLTPADVPSSLSEKTIVALCQRTKPERSLYWFKEYLSGYVGDDPCVLDFCAGAALGVAVAEPDTWKRWLPVISRCYLNGSSKDPFIGWRFTRAMRDQIIPEAIAKSIVDNGTNYPIELVSLAEEVCTQAVAAAVKPVGVVARERKWFG